MKSFVAIGALGLLIFGAAAYHFGLFSPAPPGVDPTRLPPPPDYGELLYSARPEAPAERPEKQDSIGNPILISATLAPWDKIEVSPPIDGQILFVGEEIPLGAQLVAGMAPFLPQPCYINKLSYSQVVGSSAKNAKDQFIQREIVFVYRRLKEGDVVQLGQMLAQLNPLKAHSDKRSKQAKVEQAKDEHQAAVATERETKVQYDRIYELHRNSPGTVSKNDLGIAQLQWKKSEAEAKMKESAIKEARSNVDQAELYLSQHSILNYLPVETAVIKEIPKKTGEAVKPQDKVMELQSLKRFKAEGIIEVQYYDRIRKGMRAMIEPSQEEAPLLPAQKIHTGEVTSVAFTNRGLPKSPPGVNPAMPLVVSGSEDKTVYVWDRHSATPMAPPYIAPIRFSEPVRVVACSPHGAAHNLILAGCADGNIYSWDLDNPDPEQVPRKIPSRDPAHREPVTSLAFSPDGKFFASGSDNASIKIWNLETVQIVQAMRQLADIIKKEPDTWNPGNGEVRRLLALAARHDGAKELQEAVAGADREEISKKLNELFARTEQSELVYALDAEHGAASTHNGPITSLHFTPQCRLVSASRDNTVRVWTLRKKGVVPLGPTHGRKGDVSQLGVSENGRLMIVDQGKTLQIKTVADGWIVNTLKAAGNAVDFQTVAIFSPDDDASLLLTAGASEGRLTLWTTPGKNRRGYEVRQFITDERGPVTCAAFAPTVPQKGPDGKTVYSSPMAVSGNKDGYVYYWPIPTPTEVEKHQIKDIYLTTIYQEASDLTTRHIRIGVDVRNQFSQQYLMGRLIPGRNVTIVIEP